MEDIWKKREPFQKIRKDPTSFLVSFRGWERKFQPVNVDGYHVPKW